MLQFVLPRQIQPKYCREIVAHSGGRYYPIADLTPHSVHNIVSMERSSPLPRDHLRDESARGVSEGESTGIGIFMIRARDARFFFVDADYLNVCKSYMKSTHPALI